MQVPFYALQVLVTARKQGVVVALQLSTLRIEL
jgi:hypothetical protein